MADTEVVASEPSPSTEVTPAPVADAPAPEAVVSKEPTPAQAEDAVYDAAAAEMLKEDAEDASNDAAVKPAPVEPAATPAPEAALTTPITESELSVLKRAGYEDDELKGWDRTKIEAKVGKLRTAQAEQDRIGSEYARLKQAGEQPKPETKPEPKQTPPPTSDFGKRLAEAKAKAVQDYDEGIAPVFDLVADLSSRNEQLSQQAAMVPVMTDMMGEIVLDMAMESLKTKYPTLEKPEARSKVTERFWTEWNTGAYFKAGSSLRTQMMSALENAAKVTFINTNEQTAAANLVTGNKARLAGQPKAPTSAPRRGPVSKDDIYAEAFNETLGKEMAGR